MHVVGGDQRQILAVGQIDQMAFNGTLLGHIVTLQFDVQPVREHRRQTIDQCGGVRLAVEQHRIDDAARTAGERDQAVAVFFQPVERDMWPVARLHFQVRRADQLQQIEIAGLVLHQHRQIGRLGLEADRRTIVDLNRQQATDDRLHPGLGHGIGNVEHAEQIVGVAHRHRRHVGPAHPFGQFLRLDRPFQHGIGASDPKMHERRNLLYFGHDPIPSALERFIVLVYRSAVGSGERKCRFIHSKSAGRHHRLSRTGQNIRACQKKHQPHARRRILQPLHRCLHQC